MNYRIRKNYDIPRELLCFSTKNFVSTGLPVRKPKDNEFKRQNNLVTTNIVAPKDIGLPYGKVPRLAIIAMVTYIYKTKKRVMNIGTGNREHYENLGINNNTSGRCAADKNRQLNRLLNCAFYFKKRYNDGRVVEERFFIAKRNTLIDINTIEQIEFSDDFYKYALDKKNIVAINKGYLIGLSAFQMDLYISLAYWINYLQKQPYKNKKTVISYENLNKQLGLAFTKIRHFVRCIKNNIGRVEVCLNAKVNVIKNGIQIEVL